MFCGENYGGSDGSFGSPEERIRQLEEENRRLKAENARQAREQREREISQARRDAVNARSTAETPPPEASTPEDSTRTESFTAASAVALQSQNIVRQPSSEAIYSTGQNFVLPYRPSEEQVTEFMCESLHLRKDVAEEEARKFLRYNDVRGWKFSGTTALNWQGTVQLWVNKTEERRGRLIYEPQLTGEQQQEEERKRIDREIDAEARAYLQRIIYKEHGGFDGEDGAKACKVYDAIQAGASSEDHFGRVVKRTGELLIGCLAWTYAEIIIMETYEHANGGDFAKMIKDRIDSGVPFVSWFWHGMAVKVVFYLERWYKGLDRPLKRLVPIKIGTKTKAQRSVPEYWKYLKDLWERGIFDAHKSGPIVRKIDEKIARNDFSGQFGDIAEWIVTGKVPDPQPPSETPLDETRGGNSKPLKGIINKAMRNMGRET